MLSTIKKVITGPADWLLYSVLNEKQRKALVDLFNEDQKKKIKQMISGKKQVQRKLLQQIKYHLYNLGFTEKALQQLEDYSASIDDPYLKRLAAWELTLWHANQHTQADAEKALHYISMAADGEKEENQLRRIAIIQAELLERCGKIEEAKKIIDEMLTRQNHADLYLAAANLEKEVGARVQWMNKAMNHYGLQEIEFASDSRKPEYDDLRTLTMTRDVKDGPKVSVILPAYNAETGIKIAIESILSQTWRNIELLAVDDCSPDNTAAVIQQYAEKDSRVKFLSTPVNSGPYVARNIALKEATGEFVTINDSDDWSHAEKIEIQVKHLINNESIIANTSEHARLTEELKLYRRGTPGKYIFPNMSSIMFRRQPVLEQVGFWDSVRFAADGEFKRRLIKVFGKNKYVDLKTGPLSLPRQTVTSLTGSSAFGYNGFFKGVRKEYVEGLEFNHQTAEILRYPFPMEERPFQVPEPMWPAREEKNAGNRTFDLVIAADFRLLNEEEERMIKDLCEMKNLRKGLVQINQYDLKAEKNIRSDIREMVNAKQVQMLVFGEHILTDDMVIINPLILKDYQRYIPEVQAESLRVIVSKKPSDRTLYFDCTKNLIAYFKQAGKWYPATSEIKEALQQSYSSELSEIDYINQVWEKRWVYDEETD